MILYNLKIISFTLLVLLLLFSCQKTPSSYECTDTIGCIDLAPGEPLSIGVIQDFSGGATTIGKVQLQVIKLAVEQRGGLLLRHPISLQIEDEKCSPEGGVNSTSKIVMHSKVVAILGTTCSAAAVPASKIMSEAGLVMISGSNTSPSLTAEGGLRGTNWYPGYFRTKFNDLERGRGAAIFAFKELGITRAATINDGDPYTNDLTQIFKSTFTSLGGTVVLDTTVNRGDTNMRPVLTAVANSQAQLLFMPIFQPEGDFLVLQAREISGLNDIVLMNSASLLLDSFIEKVGAAGVGMYFISSHVPSTSPVQELTAAFIAKYGSRPQHLSFMFPYDAANLLFDAIEAIALQEADGTIHIGRQALRDRLYSTSGFEGVSGKLSCDEFGDCGVATFNIMRLDNPTTGAEGIRSNIVFKLSSNP